MTHEVVYVGGPRHGEREVRPGDVFSSPRTITFPTMHMPAGRHGEAIYRRAELADTPGAITYVYEVSEGTET